MEEKDFIDTELLPGNKVSPCSGPLRISPNSTSREKRMKDVDDLTAKPSGLSEEDDDEEEMGVKIFTPMII